MGDIGSDVASFVHILCPVFRFVSSNFNWNFLSFSCLIKHFHPSFAFVQWKWRTEKCLTWPLWAKRCAIDGVIYLLVSFFSDAFENRMVEYTFNELIVSLQALSFFFCCWNWQSPELVVTSSRLVNLGDQFPNARWVINLKIDSTMCTARTKYSFVWNRNEAKYWNQLREIV